MGLSNCPDCGHQVSDSAAACPKCGRPGSRGGPPTSTVIVKKGSSAGGVFGGLFLFFVGVPVMLLGSCVGCAMFGSY